MKWIMRLLIIIFLYKDLNSYSGGEPCQCFVVIEHEHPRVVWHHLMKDFMEKVFVLDEIKHIVSIKTDLEDKEIQIKLLV